jgi:FAD synthase
MTCVKFLSHTKYATNRLEAQKRNKLTVVIIKTPYKPKKFVKSKPKTILNTNNTPAQVKQKKTMSLHVKDVL